MRRHAGRTLCTVAQKLEYEELRAIVTDLLMDAKKAEAWMKTKNLNLGGMSPLSLILSDRGDKVRQFIEDRGIDETK